MSAVAWLLLVALVVVLAVFVVLGADDTRRRRRCPRVTQRSPRVPYLPDTASGPWHPEFLLIRGRRVRAARARYRYPREF